MGKQQTETFKNFVEGKQRAVDDQICLLEECNDRLRCLEDFLICYNEESNIPMNEASVRGIGYIVGTVTDDLRLIVADMKAEMDADIAEFRKREVQENKEGAQVAA